MLYARQSKSTAETGSLRLDVEVIIHIAAATVHTPVHIKYGSIAMYVMC